MSAVPRGCSCCWIGMTLGAERIVIGRGEHPGAFRVAAPMRYDRTLPEAGPSCPASPQATATVASRSPPATGSAGKLAELDGLRGVAAVIVVAWHFTFAF